MYLWLYMRLTKFARAHIPLHVYISIDLNTCVRMCVCVLAVMQVHKYILTTFPNAFVERTRIYCHIDILKYNNKYKA